MGHHSARGMRLSFDWQMTERDDRGSEDAEK